MKHNIIHAVTNHMRQRFNEWVSAVALMVWGVGFWTNPELAPATYFGIPTSAMALAVLCSVIGFSRVILLFINGAWGLSPHFRATAAGISACTWAAMWSFMFNPGQLITSLATVGALVALDIYSLWYAAEEARLADLSRRGRGNDKE